MEDSTLNREGAVLEPESVVLATEAGASEVAELAEPESGAATWRAVELAGLEKEAAA